MSMNFRKRHREEPEINLVPFIDVLLVILIFLMLSTTYSKYTELKINLPVADSQQASNYPKQIIVTVSADGDYTVNSKMVPGRSVEGLTAALSAEVAGASEAERKERIVIVTADALSAHQSVINVMDAARRANLPQLTFATQKTKKEN